MIVMRSSAQYEIKRSLGADTENDYGMEQQLVYDPVAVQTYLLVGNRVHTHMASELFDMEPQVQATIVYNG